ncbi:meiotic recombination protein REC8 homolog [Mercenaria mercenaria]|uniref:meiotic recombination protein REC8 homolog n=1 Tax=Mercenaria mercenaria TaxID=6596 RepID=UPI00234F308F|nr:meiotic recombination protein REC8 homolog [Mercenaria mercenaria]
MFYSQDILQKRGGKFGKIWLAATKMSKLSRREVATVNVEKCCDDILAYIELRITPVRQGGRRPRFSLYLSALLMYGVVRIHQKHMEYLLNDVSTAFLRVSSLPILQGQEIDLPVIPKADQVTNPEMPLQEIQPEEDLFLSQLDIEMLRAGHVEPGDFWGLNGATPARDSPPSKKRKKHQDEEVAPVANVDQITLKEPPPLIVDTPLSPIQVPKDMDLPMLDGREMEMLLGQIEEPGLQVLDLLPTSTPFNLDADSSTRQRLRSEQSALESPSRIRQEDKEKTPERPSTEVPENRAWRIIYNFDFLKICPFAIQRKSLELELTQAVPSPRQRKRKRQLAFADAETQIPKNKMKQNMTTGKDTCELFVLPDVQGVGATDLLAVAGRKELRKEIWHPLWARNARFRRNIPEEELAEAVSPPQLPAPDQLDIQIGQQVPEVPLIPDLGETLRPPQPPLSPVLPPQPEDRRRSKRKISTLEESVEELRRISVSMMGTPAREISSIEIPRDASTSRIGTPKAAGLDDTLILDDSKDTSKSRGSARKRRTRSSVSKEDEQQAPPPVQELPSGTSLQTSHTSTGRTLYDVVEEPRYEEQFIAVPLLQYITEDQEQMKEELLRSIEGDIEQAGQYTTFHNLCPPQLVDRKTAAKKFSVLLELCAQGSVTAKQKRSYEDIYIRMAE